MALVAAQDTITLNIRGIEMRMLIPAFSDDAQAFKRMHLTRPEYQYEAVMVALLERILRQQAAPVFLDLGAFIGYYTLFAAGLLKDRARVYGIESNPRHVAVIRQAVALNNLTNAEVIQAVLSDCAEPVRSLGTEVFANSDGPGVLLQSETCDGLCRRLGIEPTVAKMDVHGFEGKILGGMKEVLGGALEYLLLELHPNAYLKKYTPGISRLMILDMLEEAGFKTYYLAGHRYSVADGLLRFEETGRFAYLPLNRETREMLLFDRAGYVFVVAAKSGLEDLLGPSLTDPGLENPGR